MKPGTDDPKDLGSKKWNNEQKESPKNEGFSGENLPKNYNTSKDEMKPEIEKDEKGDIDTVKRARDVNEKKAALVSEISDKATRNGEIVDKSRGTKNDDEAMETAKNRDFNSDIEKDRYDLKNKNE